MCKYGGLQCLWDYVCVAEWVGISSISHLKLLFFGCQCLVDKLLNPQRLQLYFLTHINQLVLVKTHTETHTVWFFNKHIPTPEHHQPGDATRKSCLFKYQAKESVRNTSCNIGTHPWKNNKVRILHCSIYEHNFPTLSATNFNKMAG